jgi:hypothetical protein
MPIVIWGSRGLTSRLDSGNFYCPRCDGEAGYHLKQVREFFTLYFIPLFPIGGAQRYVECDRCGGTFEEAVLDMEPPTEADRLLGHLYNELQTGSSLEDVERRLVQMGMEEPRARTVVGQMAEGQTWACERCGDHYLNVVKKCTRCRD